MPFAERGPLLRIVFIEQNYTQEYSDVIGTLERSLSQLWVDGGVGITSLHVAQPFIASREQNFVIQRADSNESVKTHYGNSFGKLFLDREKLHSST